MALRMVTDTEVSFHRSTEVRLGRCAVPITHPHVFSASPCFSPVNTYIATYFTSILDVFSSPCPPPQSRAALLLRDGCVSVPVGHGGLSSTASRDATATGTLQPQPAPKACHSEIRHKGQRRTDWWLQNSHRDAKHSTDNVVNNTVVTMHGARGVLETSGEHLVKYMTV